MSCGIIRDTFLYKGLVKKHDRLVAILQSTHNKGGKTMRKMVVVTAMMAILAVMLVVGTGFAKPPIQEGIQPLVPGKCCIAGKYKGISVDDPACPVGPKTGSFIMVLHQTDCGRKVTGEIIDPHDGKVKLTFVGTVTPVSRNCCRLEGQVKGVPGGPDAKCLHDFRATLCRNKSGKWQTKDGVYKDLSGHCCSGTFRMEQM